MFFKNIFKTQKQITFSKLNLSQDSGLDRFFNKKNYF